VASILIVDDNLMIRTLLREILTTGAHEVVGEACDGLEAPTFVHDLRPELVLLDLVMPGRDGLTTLNFLRMIDPNLAVIVCSASLDQAKVVRSLRLGAKGFIAKPFNRESVLAAVDVVVQELDGRVRLVAAAHELPATAPDEKREFVRVSASLPVAVAPAIGDAFETRTVDLSGSGMLLACGSLEMDTLVAFYLELRPGEPRVPGRARVVRVTPEGRLALQFREMSIADHERLNAYIAEVREPAPAAAAAGREAAA
jgi:two-component system chemotaxis response regulator CheY